MVKQSVVYLKGVPIIFLRKIVDCKSIVYDGRVAISNALGRESGCVIHQLRMSRDVNLLRVFLQNTANFRDSGNRNQKGLFWLREPLLWISVVRIPIWGMCA